MAIDWEAISKEKELEKKQSVISRDNRAREIILHPVSILVQIFNIIMIYSLSGFKSALAITFILLVIIVFFILQKPDEEA
mgnify:CR=1 FL=1